MFRRMTLSIFGGALLAVVFAFSQPAEAACNGACADTVNGGWEFDSCRLKYVVDWATGLPYVTYTCYYTKEPVMIQEPTARLEPRRGRNSAD
jgi:hypothetical protein